MKVVDSTLLIDLLRGNKQAVNFLSKNQSILTTQINMYEVIRGLFLKTVSSAKMQQSLELFNAIKVLSLDDRAIQKSAEISAELIKSGKFISDCDCMTAGIALSNNINIVVTRNINHFNRIEGINAESY